jgi:hypothetical protein
MNPDAFSRDINLLPGPQDIPSFTYLHLLNIIFSLSSVLLTLFVLCVSLVRRREGILILNGVYVILLLLILNIPRLDNRRIILGLALCKYYLTLSFYFSFLLIYYSSIPKIAIKPEKRSSSILAKIVCNNSIFVSVVFPASALSMILGNIFAQSPKRPMISISYFSVYSLEQPAKPVLFALIMLPGVCTVYLMVVFLLNLIWRRAHCKKHLAQSKISRIDIGKCIFNIIFYSLILFLQLVQMLLGTEGSRIEISTSLFGLMYFSNFGFSKQFRNVALRCIRAVLPFCFAEKKFVAKNSAFGFKNAALRMKDEV